MRFIVRTGLKITPFELLQGIKLTTEFTYILKDEKSYLSPATELMKLNIQAAIDQIPIRAGWIAKKQATDYQYMTKKKKDSLLLGIKVVEKTG